METHARAVSIAGRLLALLAALLFALAGVVGGFLFETITVGGDPCVDALDALLKFRLLFRGEFRFKGAEFRGVTGGAGFFTQRVALPNDGIQSLPAPTP